MDEQRLAFEDRIYQTWAVYWGCDPALFSVPGVTLCQRINQGNSTGIHIWKIHRHLFVEHTDRLMEGEELQKWLEAHADEYEIEEEEDK